MNTMIFEEVKQITDYGYVSRAQNRYSVPALPDAGIPDLVSGNRCPVECSRGNTPSSVAGFDLKSICEQHKPLCIGGLIALLILLTK